MVNQPKFNRLNPLVMAMGIFLLVSLSACQQAVPSSQRFSSEKGVNVEAFMPADTILFGKVGTRDQEQLDHLKTLNGYFSGDPIGSIVKEFNQGFKQGANLNEIGLDYDQDILPILNSKSQFFFAMSPRQNAQPVDAEAAGSTSSNVNLIVAMTIADEGKFDALLDKQISKNLLKKDDYNGQAVYSQISTTEDMPAYLCRYMDTVFLATDLDLLKTGLDNVKAKKDLLNENAVFQRAMSTYTPNLAVVYFNLDEVIKVIGSSEGKKGEEMTKALAGTDAANIESGMLVLTAEINGIRIASKVLAKSGVDLTKNKTASSMQSYLIKKIPAVAPIFYFEGADLKTSYESMFKVLSEDAQFTDDMNQMKDFLKTQNLDLEKDVLAFMDKGVALLFEDTGTPIPGFGIYLDASSNLDGAAKTAVAINKGFDSLLAEMTADSPDISMIISKEEVKPGKLWKFKINLDAILAAAPSEMAKKLTGQKVELYYGLLDDGVMTIALKPDLEKVYAKDQVVEKGQEFVQAMAFVSGARRGMTYFAPAQLVLLVDSYLKMVADSTGQASTIPEYDQIKSNIEPIKSLIFAVGEQRSDEVNVDFFMHIAQ